MVSPNKTLPRPVLIANLLVAVPVTLAISTPTQSVAGVVFEEEAFTRIPLIVVEVAAAAELAVNIPPF